MGSISIKATLPIQINAVAEKFLPGITLVCTITAAAYGFRELPVLSHISPMITAIFVGILFANFTTVPSIAGPGINLLGKKMLRLAVALLGLQLTLGQLWHVGFAGFLVLSIVVLSTYAFTIAAGRLFGVPAGLTKLLAAGTSICGASAIAAANSVEKAEDEDVAYAVACITLFGTIAMLTYPIIGGWLQLETVQYGFWVGASIHEVAQVVAAGYQAGRDVGEFSVIVKLSRVLLLAPLLLVMITLARRVVSKSAETAALQSTQIVPFFVLAFILLMLANSVGAVPFTVKSSLTTITPMILTAALAALGLGTHISSLRAKGFRPLLVAGLASAFLAISSLLMLHILP